MIENTRHSRDVFKRLSVIIVCLLVGGTQGLCANVDFVEGDGRITIVIDDSPVAIYSYREERIKRPYFAHVRTPAGVQVTRQFPPVAGQDPTDHDAFHPGIWLSFGDINGCDYWRGAAEVRHEQLVEKPQPGEKQGSFAVRNAYLNPNDSSMVVCQETALYTFAPRRDGFLLSWDSTFSSDHEFAFGDQEEMGLGIRIATPIRVEKKTAGGLPAGNGTIVDAQGRTNGEQIWGNSAAWCDYSGTIAGQHVGIAIFCHPDNFRPSWFHARDYGLLVANAFGRQAFRKGEKSSVIVKPGEKMRLRYGVFVHASPSAKNVDIPSAYDDYVRKSGK
jgi:hypothetical protein